MAANDFQCIFFRNRLTEELSGQHTHTHRHKQTIQLLHLLCACVAQGRHLHFHEPHVLLYHTVLKSRFLCMIRKKQHTLNLFLFLPLYKYMGVVIDNYMGVALLFCLWICKVIGEKVAPLKKVVCGSIEWAQLEDAGECKVDAFIDSLEVVQAEGMCFIIQELCLVIQYLNSSDKYRPHCNDQDNFFCRRQTRDSQLNGSEAESWNQKHRHEPYSVKAEIFVRYIFSLFWWMFPIHKI